MIYLAAYVFVLIILILASMTARGVQSDEEGPFSKKAWYGVYFLIAIWPASLVYYILIWAYFFICIKMLRVARYLNEVITEVDENE